MAISGPDLLEAPTTYKAYVGEYHHKIWHCMVQYFHFKVLKWPLNILAHVQLYVYIFYIHINIHMGIYCGDRYAVDV